MTVTVGIVGLGDVVQSHLRAMAGLPALCPVSVCDVDETKARAVSDALGCRGFTSHADLLQDPPDLVVVALPHDLHAEVAVAAMCAGCHVLVEKPMAVTVAQCRLMLATAAQSGKLLQVSELQTTDAGALMTGKRFAAGDLGRFLAGSCLNGRNYFVPSRPRWFLNPATSGGGMFSNVGVHRLATARNALSGLAPRSVRASVSCLPEYKVEACTSAIVLYEEGGAMLYEEIGYFPRADWLNYGVHFAFEGGIVAWTDSVWRMLKRDGSVVEEKLPPPEGYALIYARLLQAIRGERPVHQAWEFAEDVAISQACYASSQLGREIHLSDPEWAVRPVTQAVVRRTPDPSPDRRISKSTPGPMAYAEAGDAQL